MSVYKNTSFVLPLQKKSTKRALLTIKSPAKEIESTNRGILTVIIYLCSPKKIPISNMKKIWILAVLTICSVATQAQEVFINADLVSSYIWRGMKNGNASVQPTLGVEWKGWTLSAWGSTEFRNENNEIDLTLEYEYKNLQLCLNNYFYQSEDEPFKYFHYTPRTTGHTFEAGAVYTFSERFPLSIGWYTTFAGNDYRENEERAWSSYCEFSYPFTVKGVDLAVEAGFTPWEGEYADKLNVVNVGLSATKTLNISSGFTPAIFGKLIANPYENRFYFVFGISL